MNPTMKSIIAKFKTNYIPTRDEHLAIYLQTGEIAKAVKPAKGEEVSSYRTFINGQLYDVPAALVTTKLPVFRINKTVDQLQVGDIIRTGNDGKYTYRRIDNIDQNSGRISTTSFSGATGNKIIAINDLFLGSATISVAINLMKGFMGNGVNPMQNNALLPLLMLSDGDSFLDGDNSLDTLLMMSMMGGNNMNMQSMLPMMMLAGGDFGGDKMTDIMMMSMMMNNGGNNAANPFASLFGGLMQQPTVCPSAPDAQPIPVEATPVEREGVSVED